MDEQIVIYEPWSVSGELVQEAKGHEHEQSWAIVIPHEDHVELVEGGLTYDEAYDKI